MHKRPSGVDMRERLWLLRCAALMLGSASAIALPIVLASPDMPRLNVLNCVLLIICSSLGFFVANRGNLNIGGYCLAGALMYCISTLPPEQLMNGPLSTTYIIAIVIGGITGGARGIWILSVIAIFLYGLIGLSSGIWTINSSTALFTIGMTTIIVGIIMHSLERALQDASKLVETEHELHNERHIRTLIRSLQHELKAHANGVRGLVRMAREVANGTLVPTESWDSIILKGLEGRAHRLENMMQHLLIIAQGQLPTADAFQFVSLRSMIANVELESSVWEHQIHVSIHNEVTDTIIIHCIPTYMQMALDTVIRNAVEACHRSGRPTVDIWVGTSMQDNSLVVCIKDNGPGFPSAVMSQVNEADHPESGLFVSSAKGSGGLGLPLLRAIVLWHNGSVEIGNNRGAWVKILLPLPEHVPGVL